MDRIDAIYLARHWPRSADLTGADLTCADLTGAYLGGADFRGADLVGANFRGADLDFSSLPLWCGGQGAKIDPKLAAQFLLHALAFECDDPRYQAVREAARDLCSESHRRAEIRWPGDKKEQS